GRAGRSRRRRDRRRPVLDVAGGGLPAGVRRTADPTPAGGVSGDAGRAGRLSEGEGLRRPPRRHRSEGGGGGGRPGTARRPTPHYGPVAAAHPPTHHGGRPRHGGPPLPGGGDAAAV